jgi:N-acetylmuramoyl-L-alanine amidase
MKKRLLLSGILLLALATVTPRTLAASITPDTRPPDVTIQIDGRPAELHVPLFVLNGTTYVALRDLAAGLGADGIIRSDGSAMVSAPNLTITATAGDVYLVANDRYLFVPYTVQQIDGNIMVPVRVLCKAFDASVYWDGATQTIYISKGSGAIAPGNVFYDQTDLYWMSRIINAEARGEPLTGKIAVGSVIMNRLNSPEFPKTVYDVIFDNESGVQFTPTEDGSIYYTPSEECVIAAMIALDGGNTAGDSLYFAATTHCWAGRNRPMSMTIGNHYFFA